MVIKISIPIFLPGLIFRFSKRLSSISYIWHTIAYQAVNIFTYWLSYSWFATSEQQCDNISKKCLNAALFDHTIAVQTVVTKLFF